MGYEYKEAVEQFRARQTLIESEVWQQMQQFMPKRHLATANRGLGHAIIAALSLGDVNYLDPDIDWIEGLLVNHNEMPPEALDAYLETYYDALVKHLGKTGYLVIEWMARLLGKDLPNEVRQLQQIRRLQGGTAREN